MNRIEETFQQLKQKQHTALIGCLIGGDPNLTVCMECLHELELNGCDMIMIGLPFSDPIAEEETLQKANSRALQHHITTKDLMKMVASFRTQSKIALLYYVYYNQIFSYGIKAFLQACHDVGIDGLCIPDLPYEHRDELLPIANKLGIIILSYISPISKQRTNMIASNSQGFLNCESSLESVETFVDELRQYTTTPLAFHLNHVEELPILKQYVDGIIVDNLIVKQIETISTSNQTLKDVGAYVKALSEYCHCDIFPRK